MRKAVIKALKNNRLNSVDNKRPARLFWVVLALVGSCLFLQTTALGETTSSCVGCHTHYGHLKSSLAKTAVAVSPLIEGMG